MTPDEWEAMRRLVSQFVDTIVNGPPVKEAEDEPEHPLPDDE